MKPIGTIEPVNLREVWPNEARDFTPWLAKDAGLVLLSETLGLQLDLDSIEKNVGPYKTDILAKIVDEDEDEDHFIVIENQLAQTDHDHLGKLITYAAGHGAVGVVWIAENFTDEHRQAIDWLNENMTDTDFFALEIKLFKIGDSAPAPQFKIISSPNEWAKKVKSTHGREYSDLQMDQLHYWEELRGYALDKSSLVRLSQKPHAQHWYTIAIGRSGFELSITVNTREKRIGCEIYISHPKSKSAFDQLMKQKEDIEKELGFSLEWQRLEEKKACRVAFYNKGSIEDPVGREAAIQWHLDKIQDFYRVFNTRIQNLVL